jgi:GST-like protein
LHAVDISKGEQFKPEFLAINPNNKIPALVDNTGATPVTVFESGAILIYLAEKAGKLLGESVQDKYASYQWVFWQIGGIGPNFGQYGHFSGTEGNDYAKDRFKTESKRLLTVLEGHLATHGPYLVGKHYTIADITNWTWVSNYGRLGFTATDFPAIQKWLDLVGARDAVKKGNSLPQ